MPDQIQPKKQLISLRKRQQFLYVGIFSFVAIMVWITGGLISSQKKTGISSELQKMAIPLNPNLDVATVSRLEEKKMFSPEELQDFPILKIPIDEKQKRSSAEADSPSLLNLEQLTLPPATAESTVSALQNEPVLEPEPTVNPAQLDFLPPSPTTSTSIQPF